MLLHQLHSFQKNIIFMHLLSLLCVVFKLGLLLLTLLRRIFHIIKKGRKYPDFYIRGYFITVHNQWEKII
jgi:hypothetical protein